jgi:uncharacterized protein YgiM (DUF1202 family)
MWLIVSRRVNTGDSFGLSFGKRITPSVRTYQGVRTLCESCAKKKDDRDKIKSVLLLVAVSVVALFSFIGSHLNHNTTSHYLPDPPAVDRLKVPTDSRPEAKPATEPGETMMVNAPQELNVRSGPGPTFDVVNKVNARDIVTVQRTEKGWSYIGSGWVRSKFLVKTDK